jgi:hypothetical protein
LDQWPEWEVARNVQFNHIYNDSQNPQTYTCLANLCVTPAFLAKLTDTNSEVRELLQYRAWQLYGWHPASVIEPKKPGGYDGLVWAPCLPPVADVRGAFNARARKRSKSRTTMFSNTLGAFLA